MPSVTIRPGRLDNGLAQVRQYIEKGLAGGKEVLVRITQPIRSLDQNAKLWAMLADVSRQVEWHGLKLKSEDWKEMFSASLRNQRTVPGIDGQGFVVLGASTSKMTKQEFSDLIELIYAFGAERGVRWTAKEMWAWQQ